MKNDNLENEKKQLAQRTNERTNDKVNMPISSQILKLFMLRGMTFEEEEMKLKWNMIFLNLLI